MAPGDGIRLVQRCRATLPSDDDDSIQGQGGVVETGAEVVSVALLWGKPLPKVKLWPIAIGV